MKELGVTMKHICDEPPSLVKGNQNLANFGNDILKLFYHIETNIKLLDV